MLVRTVIRISGFGSMSAVIAAVPLGSARRSCTSAADTRLADPTGRLTPAFCSPLELAAAGADTSVTSPTVVATFGICRVTLGL